MELVNAIARRVLPLLWRLSVLVVVFLWYLPWFALATAKWTRGVLRSLRHLPARIRTAAADEVDCPRCGLAQSLLGRWRCPTCRSVETTHAWAPCTVCGTKYPGGYIVCEDPSCGESIANPNLGGAA